MSGPLPVSSGPPPGAPSGRPAGTPSGLEAFFELGLQRVDPSHPGVRSHPADVGRILSRTERPGLGTRVEVQTVSDSDDRNAECMQAALDEMDRLEVLLTRHRDTSALSVLNSTGHLTAPPPELERVVRRAVEMHRASAGAFDISIKPLLDLFESTDPDRLSEEEIGEARALVGIDGIRSRAGVLRLERSGMGLTLDGIGKGWILDRMAEVLRDRGLTDYLVSAGGDIRTGGSPGTDRPWRIGIRDPQDGSWMDHLIHLTGGAVATSGDYERSYTPDRSFHHIVDGAEGRSPLHAASVTVIAPDAVTADVLATTLFVKGPREARSFIRAVRGCSCLIITRDGRQIRSEGWPGRPAQAGRETRP